MSSKNLHKHIKHLQTHRNNEQLSKEKPRALTRRTVKTIDRPYSPPEVYQLITAKEAAYTQENQRVYAVRDRAFLALLWLTGGRISEVVGGQQFKRVYVAGLYSDPFDKRNWQALPIGRHIGLTVGHLEISENYLTVKDMPIVKRSTRQIQRYGAHIARRGQMRYPLKTGLFKAKMRDMQVPFTLLVVEYLQQLAKQNPSADTKLFPFQDERGWRITFEITGQFPHWMRAAAENYIGHYIKKDIVNHSKYFGLVNPLSSAPYMRSDDDSDIKDISTVHDFKWVDLAVVESKKRLGF